MTDRVLKAIITGSSAGAVRAFEETSLAAKETAEESSSKFEGAGNKISGIFHKLGNSAGSIFAPLGTALNATGDKFKEAETKGASFSTGMSELGKAAGLGLAAGVAVAGAAGVKMALDFSAGTSALQAAAGISDAAAKSIGDAFLHTAGQSTFSGAQIQTAYTGVAAQLGAVQGHALDTAQAMTVMRSATDLAEASGTSLGDATSQLATTMQAFGVKASGAAHASDVLYTTGKLTGLGIDGTTNAFQRLHTMLGIATPPMGQLGGLMVDMANHGLSGRSAVSAVSTALQSLTTHAKTAGVNVFDASGKFVGMGAVIGELHAKIQGETQAQQLATVAQAFGASAASRMLKIVQSGPAAFDAATAAVNKNRAAHDAAEKRNKSLTEQWAILSSTVKDWVTLLGEKVLPIVTSVFDFIGSHTIVLVTMGAVFGGVAVTMIGFWVANTIAAMSFWTAATGGIVILVAALAVGIAWMATHWKEVWGAIKGAALDAWHFIDSKVLQPIENAFHDVVSFISRQWNAARSAVMRWGNDVIHFFEGLPSRIWSSIKKTATFWYNLARGWLADLGRWGADVASFFEGLPARIWASLKQAAGFWYNLGRGWLTDLHNWEFDALHFLEGLPSKIWASLKQAAKYWYNLGRGWLADLGQWGADVIHFFEGLPAKIISALGNVGSDIWHSIISHIPGGGVVGKALSALGLASGGIVTSPTFALIGEAGPEAVIPLGNSGVMGSNADGVSPLPAALGGIGGGGGGSVVHHHEMTVNVYGNDPQGVVDALRLYEQRAGAIPINVRGH